MKYPVKTLCTAQLKDVKPEHVLFNGLARYCDIYKGGGGYDKFNEIYAKRYGKQINPLQFVVQLMGCPLRCPYCYVTREGIDGDYTLLTDKDLLEMFVASRVEVFHLMGGAPALYLERWKQIADKVPVFHSDFILVEKHYKREWLIDLPGMHAVSFKEKYLYTEKQIELMWYNLAMLISCNVSFYITFTGKDEFSEEIAKKFGHQVLEDSFIIKLVDYEALDCDNQSYT